MSHSVVAAGMFASVFALAAATTGAATVLSAQTSVSGAADAAALAATDALFGFASGEPCERAAQLATLNRVTLDSCALSQVSVRVTVSRQVAGIQLVSSARAGLSD